MRAGGRKEIGTIGHLPLLQMAFVWCVRQQSPLAQAGSQAHNGTVRDRAPGHHPSLTSQTPVSKDHTAGR